MKIKIEPFLMKKGNRVAKAAIEFESDDSFMAGFYLVGFTICNDPEKGLFVLFPSAAINHQAGEKGEAKRKQFFFLRPDSSELIDKLESLILDTYESMTAFNTPK